MKIWVIGRHYPSVNNKMRGSFEIEQAKMLARGGHDVTYVAVVFHPVKKIKKWGFTSWEEDGIKVCGYSQFFFPERVNIRLESFRKMIFKKALDLVEKAVGIPDVIHVHYPTMITNPEIVLRYQKKGVSIVCTEHWTAVKAKTINSRETNQLSQYVNNSDGFICVGNPLKEAIIELTNTNKDITIIPNVVEDVFVPIPKQTKDFFEFITVGRLVPVKQVDRVVEAFASVLKKDPNLKLTIVGNGGEMERLRNIVLTAGIQENVEFTGTLSREKVALRIANADCLVCYSNLETFGVPIIEAWACGIPAISSDALGFEEYWKEGLGYIVDQNDSIQLKKTMQKIINEKFDSNQLHQFAIEHFSEDEIRAQIESLYARVLKNKNVLH